jgi:hypothetical protein
MYFSDGITTAKTDYRGWTQSLIDAYRAELSKGRGSASAPRSVSFPIQGISCTGHYVPDCSMSLLVTRSDGVAKPLQHRRLTGYPLDSALQKALDSAVALALANGSLNKFVGR